MKIDVLIPTKNREVSLGRSIGSILKTTADFTNTRVLVGLDQGIQYHLDRDDTLGPTVKLIELGLHDTLGALQNELASYSKADVVCLFADDMEMITPGWDNEIRAVVRQIPDGVGLFFFNDSTHPGFPSYPIVSRGWLDMLGYFVPNYFPFWFADTWLDEIATTVGRLIPLASQIQPIAQRDTTRNCRDIDFWAEVFDATRPERERDAAKLLGRMNAYRKEQFIARNARLRDQAMAATFYSQWGDESGPDERYLRAKARAQKLLEKTAA